MVGEPAEETSFLGDVLGHASVVSLRDRLVATATSMGEWEVLTHDATYKPLFSLIGQRKMAQDEGGSHALHTFLGKSGAFPGSSLQRTEGEQCFRDASSDVLPESARATTRYVFTDAPASIRATDDFYPNLECVRKMRFTLSSVWNHALVRGELRFPARS